LNIFKTGNPKTDAMVRDLVEKKQMMLSSLQQKISNIQNQIFQQNAELGDLVRNLYKNGGLTESAVSANIERVDAMMAEIDDVNVKMKDISARHDEEIDILLMPYTPPPVAPGFQQPGPAGVSGGHTCPSCRTPYVPGQDKFCMKCGSKYPEAGPAPGGGGPKCGNCNKPYVPGENAFCIGCGSRLA
jgi:hypothetical protein